MPHGQGAAAAAQKFHHISRLPFEPQKKKRGGGGWGAESKAIFGSPNPNREKKKAAKKDLNGNVGWIPMDLNGILKTAQATSRLEASPSHRRAEDPHQAPSLDWNTSATSPY